jgi:hypothetical protein
MSNQSSSGIDLEVLASGLARLRLELDRTPHKECEHYKAVINLAFAEREAKVGNEANAIQHLKKVGRVALDLAAKLGIPAIIDAVKDQTQL